MLPHIKHELKVLIAAVTFYTRIPAPSSIGHSSQHHIAKSIRYFPAIGWIVGAIAGGFLIGGIWIVGPLFAAVIYTIISVTITGAFHEDGLADTCDGFGGGWTKEDILKIMKDSRIGAFGAIGLILILMFKVATVAALSDLGNHLTLFLLAISAHTLSRLTAATVIFTHKYVSPEAHSKILPATAPFSKADAAIAITLGIIPTLALALTTQQYQWLLLPVLLYAVKIPIANLFQRKIGGYTGDCLGAVQQTTEASHYLFAFLIWNFWI